MGLLDGKVAIVTGAGRGIGREDALVLAKEGAKVVVADVGTARDEMTEEKGPADEVVDEIKKAGGEAMASYTNVADFNATKEMIDNTVKEFGELNILVNNAGILRDRMLVNMNEAEWDAVIAVHLKGTFNCTRHAAAYWRKESKEGRDRGGSVINVASDAGLIGNPGQTNYGAAKAGIAAFTLISAAELGRYGVRVNCIVPVARTRLPLETPGAIGAMMAEKPPEGEFDILDPKNMTGVIAYLGSDEAKEITGRVFHIAGGKVHMMDGWHGVASIEKDGRWKPSELVPKMKELVESVEIEDISTKMMWWM
jgi:Dehydrogenases with different specificities (related to short-chain alcohol dehydrogenases)